MYVSSEKKKFPWTRSDAAKSDDDDGRLSTISSRDGSRQSSEKRKNGHRQDSECQTDHELYQAFVLNDGVRQRKLSNHPLECIRQDRHDSDSSINSDEIFLSHPPSSAQERRQMCSKNSQSDDTSPLLGNENEDESVKVRSNTNEYSQNFCMKHLKRKSINGATIKSYSPPEVSSNEKTELYLHHVSKIKDCNKANTSGQGAVISPTCSAKDKTFPVSQNPEVHENISFLLQPSSSALYARRLRESEVRRQDDLSSYLNNSYDKYQKPTNLFGTNQGQNKSPFQDAFHQNSSFSNVESFPKTLKGHNDQSSPCLTPESSKMNPLSNEQRTQQFESKRNQTYHIVPSNNSSNQCPTTSGYTSQDLNPQNSSSQTPVLYTADNQTIDRGKVRSSFTDYEDCDLHTYTSNRKSPSETKSDTDNASILSFKTYMKKRGIELDISSIKSSQV